MEGDNMSADISRVSFSTATVIHLPPHPQSQEREDSQKSLTDEKIRKLKCEICYIYKNPDEMQTIPHKKSKENDLNGIKQCLAHDSSLLCRACVIQLNPKICPMCRDELVLPETTSIAQPQHALIAQNPQLVVNIQIHNHVQGEQENGFNDECPIRDNCRYLWRELDIFWGGVLVITTVLIIGGVTALVVTLPRH
jgi:hypothetical protein